MALIRFQVSPLVCIDAPTHRTCVELKSQFYDDLQITLDSVHRDDFLLLVGDFNAHVRCSIRGQDSAWSSVRGYHGVGNTNENGETFLSFCTLNYEYNVEKADVYKHTYMATSWN